MEKALGLVEILEPIELDDSDLTFVSGGVTQTNTQTVNVIQTSTQTAITLTNPTFSVIFPTFQGGIFPTFPGGIFKLGLIEILGLLRIQGVG
jgi:hypothetical protein